MTRAVLTVPLPSERPTLTIPEAGAFLGLSRSSAYTAAKRGDLPVLVFNGRTLRVPTARFRVMLGLDPEPLPDGPALAVVSPEAS